MNGRLQRVWCLLRLVTALVIAWHWGVGLGVLFWCAQHFALLTLFVALRWINTEAPRPAWADLGQAWFREVAAAERAFTWDQPWREWAVPDHLPERAVAGVVLLHGFSCNRGRWNPWLRRLRDDGVAFVAPTLEPAFGSIDAYADEIDAAVTRLKALTGRTPVIVAHSMGGLAARAWWRKFGSAYADRPRLISFGTPHAGTPLARFSPVYNAAQMRPDSEWLRTLPAMPDVDCAWAPCDQIAVPAGTAIQPGSRAHRFDAVGHMSMVFEPAAWALLQTALADSSLSTPRRI
jgi:triacylglycerol lipase